jgi:outer membrane biosynthesis protein TonB
MSAYLDYNTYIAMTIAEKQERNEKVSGVTVSVIIHVAILALLLLIKIAYEPPPKDENESGGVAINFGNSATGSGDVVPQSTQAGSAAPNVSSSVSDKDNNVATQELTPTVVVKKNDVKKKKTTVTPIEKPVKTKPSTTVSTHPTPAPPSPKALFPGSTSNNASSQGNTGGTGYQGSPNGTPGAVGEGTGGNGNPLGKGNGGIGYDLKGRAMTKPYRPSDNTQMTGKVVVQITVDKYGNVTEAHAIRLGSTMDDAYHRSLSENAAKQTKFNASDNMVEQHGTITYRYGLK